MPRDRISPGSPDHVEDLRDNVREIGTLLGVHEYITGRKPGYRPWTQVLNKSGLVLLVACWESYVEDLANAAFEFLVENAADPKTFPQKVCAVASAHLTQDPNPAAIWDLAGEGWRAVLSRHRDEVMARCTGQLNTPKTGNVDELFEDLIGMRHLSSRWHWQGMSKARASSYLDELVDRRCAIAHRVKAESYVTKDEVFRARSFIQRLAATSSNAVRVFIYRQTHLRAWDGVKYGQVR